MEHEPVFYNLYSYAPSFKKLLCLSEAVELGLEKLACIVLKNPLSAEDVQLALDKYEVLRSLERVKQSFLTVTLTEVRQKLEAVLGEMPQLL